MDICVRVRCDLFVLDRERILLIPSRSGRVNLLLLIRRL